MQTVLSAVNKKLRDFTQDIHILTFFKNLNLSISVQKESKDQNLADNQIFNVNLSPRREFSQDLLSLPEPILNKFEIGVEEVIKDHSQLGYYLAGLISRSNVRSYVR